jgi:dethiobiotin synthetase
VTIVLVTGTSTGVGKTISAAALAEGSRRSGRSVAVVKPVQTGVTGADPSDLATIEDLTGIVGVELVRLDDPLAPDTAARLRGVRIPPVRELADRVAVVASDVQVTYVEGAGGVLVRLDTEGSTLLDLGRRLVRLGHDVKVVVVTALALGTLNHTELAVGAVRAAGFEPAGLVLGDVPVTPGLAEQVNVNELPRVTGLPVIGAIPHGAGGLSRSEFTAAVDGWFDRSF